MAVFRINAHEDRPRLHMGGGAVERDLSRLGEIAGPVILMVHGYNYQPGHPSHCPHTKIFSLRSPASTGRASSWLRQLGFGTGHANEGLAVAFGWPSRNAIWQAKRRARSAGIALAKTVAALRRHVPNRPVNILAHSLGSELAFEALAHLPAGAIDRIILMTGASYISRAAEALGTPAGQTAELINVTSRENDTFDFLFERLIAPPRPGDRAIGQGLTAPNAVTLQLDCPDTLAHLNRIGLPIGPPQRRICHWSAYTRPGVLRAYHDLLRHHDTIPLSLIKQGLPESPAPRWSRLLAPPAMSLPLPFAQKPS